MPGEIAISRSRQSILIEIGFGIAFAAFCYWVSHDPESSSRLHARSVLGTWVALAGVAFGLWNLASPPTLTATPAGLRFQQWFTNAFAPWDQVGVTLMGSPFRHARIMLGKKKYGLAYGWPLKPEGVMEFIRTRGQSMAGQDAWAPASLLDAPQEPDPFAQAQYDMPPPQPYRPQRGFGAAPAQNSIVSDAPRFGRRGA